MWGLEGTATKGRKTKPLAGERVAGGSFRSLTGRGNVLPARVRTPAGSNGLFHLAARVLRSDGLTAFVTIFLVQGRFRGSVESEQVDGGDSLYRLSFAHGVLL